MLSVQRALVMSEASLEVERLTVVMKLKRVVSIFLSSSSVLMHCLEGFP